MGTAREPRPAKFFVAFLTADLDLLPQVEADLTAFIGPLDARSEVVPWAAAEFYEKEMGADLRRGYFSCARLDSPQRLAEFKLRTQEIESRYLDEESLGRRVNLDPGYVDLFKVVLASTKNASQRIYLRSGIYAEATLFFRAGAFHGLSYTYADYLWPEAIGFLSRLRARYLEQLRDDE